MGVDIQNRVDWVDRSDFAQKAERAYYHSPDKPKDNFLATLLRRRAFLDGILGDAEPHVVAYVDGVVQVIQFDDRAYLVQMSKD